jgi:hypothetical protein
LGGLGGGNANANANAAGADVRFLSSFEHC